MQQAQEAVTPQGVAHTWSILHCSGLHDGSSTSSLVPVSTKVPGAGHHYLDVEWLTEAFHRVRRNSAPGVDGQTVAQNEEHLEANLPGLLDRAKSGAYLAPPVKRVYVPKDNGESRPIGIPTTEDKVLAPVYELA